MPGVDGASWCVVVGQFRMDEEGLRLVPLSARQPSPSISPSVLSASVKSTLPSQLYRVPLFPASSTLSSPSRFSRESSIVSKFPRASPAHNDRNKNAAHRSALFKDRACRFSISLLSSFSFSLLLFHERANRRVLPATLFTPGMNLRRSEADTAGVLTALSRITCPTPFVR